MTAGHLFAGSYFREPDITVFIRRYCRTRKVVVQRLKTTRIKNKEVFRIRIGQSYKLVGVPEPSEPWRAFKIRRWSG